MKVLVLGDGLLGSEITNQTGWGMISRKKDGIDANFFEDWKHLIDDYDVVVNCIAFTKTYENNRLDNWNLNVVFVDKLIDYCNYNSKKLVHISTDYLYAGSVTEAKEDDLLIPVNTWYGKTKLIGDSLVQLRSNDFLICRLSHKPTPFPYQSAWVDIKTNCDSVDVISKLVIELINLGANGVFNVGTEVKSIWDLAKKTNKNIEKSKKPNYVPDDISIDITKLNNFLKNNYENF